MDVCDQIAKTCILMYILQLQALVPCHKEVQPNDYIKAS